VETAGAGLAGALAFLIGWQVGRRWAPRPASAMLSGLIVGGLCVGLYFLVSAWIETRWPDLLDAYVVGLHLIIVILAAPVLGALGALLGYRRSMGQRLF
jgi:hypothetical protein